MKIKNWKYLSICLLILVSNISLLNAQCDWLYLDRDPDSYTLDGGNIVLFYCEDSMGEISAPSQYTEVYWEYTTETGQECENWDWTDDGFFFSVDFNDPCMGELSDNVITVTFHGITNDPTNPDVCEFDILFADPGGPRIEIENQGLIYDTSEQIIVCENDDITLIASGLGSYPDYTSFQWYINGELIDGENTIELSLQNTNYDINEANIFYFSASNYCSQGTYIDSEWQTITIYEGYDNCDPCEWDLPNHDDNEFFGFCIDCEGDGYFPEKPNNEENRSFENPNKIPTCEATIYRLSIYNRLGRKIFQSEYDNHPWNGKLANGRKCKAGTYYYKMEYTLNPALPEDSQNETKFSTGTVFLNWGN